jgi:hypothetical protein
MRVGDRVKVTNKGSMLLDREGVVKETRFEHSVSVLLDEDKARLGADIGCHNLLFMREELEVIDV